MSPQSKAGPGRLMCPCCAKLNRYKFEHPQPDLCVMIQLYYSHNLIPTKVLAASLTSVDEVMSLAGVQHIKIAPPLLRELSTTALINKMTDIKPLFCGLESIHYQPPATIRFVDEAAFRLAVTRDNNGASELKMIQVSFMAHSVCLLELSMLGLCRRSTFSAICS